MVIGIDKKYTYQCSIAASLSYNSTMLCSQRIFQIQRKASSCPLDGARSPVRPKLFLEVGRMVIRCVLLGDIHSRRDPLSRHVWWELCQRSVPFVILKFYVITILFECENVESFSNLLTRKIFWSCRFRTRLLLHDHHCIKLCKIYNLLLRLSHFKSSLNPICLVFKNNSLISYLITWWIVLSYI